MAFSMLYITCQDSAEAEKLSATLLEERLIACTNIFPMNSHFWWQGKISHENEMVVVMKTRQSLTEVVRERILQLHSYDTPCVIHWTAEANKAYEKWIMDETSGSSS